MNNLNIDEQSKTEESGNEVKKNIVVISGDGKDLDISKVYDHLNVDKPSEEDLDKEHIVIPPTKGQ